MLSFLLLCALLHRILAASPTLANVAGSYELEYSGLSFCTKTVEFQGSGARLAASDILWQGVPCRSGQVTLIEDTWNKRWPLSWRKSFGKIVDGKLKDLVCGPQEKLTAWGFVFTRPVVQISTQMRSTAERFAFRPGKLYFTVWNIVGQCVYRQKSVVSALASP
eukprot:IDg10074t1